MIWLITGAVAVGVMWLLIILYASGDLKRMTCGHHNTETQSYRDPGETEYTELYWKCHDCGKTRGRPL